MFYLIDGYNLIFSFFYSKKPLREMREKLTRYLQSKFAQKNLLGMIVFDGSHLKEEESGLSYPSPLVVAYTPKGQNADEYIIETLQTQKNKKQICVVTNDRLLQNQAKSEGAKIAFNESFLNQMKKRKKSHLQKEVYPSQKEVDELEKIFEERLHGRFDEDLDF